MKPLPEETEIMLRQRFSEQKQRDAARVPSFDQILCRTRTRSPSPQGLAPFWRLALTVGAAAALMVTMAVLHTRRVMEAARAEAQARADARLLAAAQMIWDWESPTEFLVESSDQTWMGELPTFNSPSRPVLFDDDSQNQNQNQNQKQPQPPKEGTTS